MIATINTRTARTGRPRAAPPSTRGGSPPHLPPPLPPGPCDVSAISPDNGAVAGGETVTVLGNDFSSNRPRIFFGTEMTLATFVDPNTLTVVVPPSVTGAGPVNISYADDDGCSKIPACVGCYTYN